MKVTVREHYVGKKTAIEWPQAKMKKGSDKKWLEELSKVIEPIKQDLIQMYKSGKKLKIKVLVSNKKKNIEPLDIHDALANIVNKLTDILFPRPPRKPIPQTQDRAFWECKAFKVIGEPKVEIEIQELI